MPRRPLPSNEVAASLPALRRGGEKDPRGVHSSFLVGLSHGNGRDGSSLDANQDRCEVQHGGSLARCISRLDDLMTLGTWISNEVYIISFWVCSSIY